MPFEALKPWANKPQAGWVVHGPMPAFRDEPPAHPPRAEDLSGGAGPRRRGRPGLPEPGRAGRDPRGPGDHRQARRCPGSGPVRVLPATKPVREPEEGRLSPPSPCRAHRSSRFSRPWHVRDLPPVYGFSRQGRETAMNIGRRELLAGATSLGLATMVRSPGAITVRAEYPIAKAPRWHPLTQSLLDRANRAGQQVDRSRVERLIQEVAGEHGRPVIKWMDTPGRAFEYLLRFPLDELAQMPTAQFWPFPPPVSAASGDEEERSVELYLHATQVLRVEEHGRTLLAPKRSYKAQAIASGSLSAQVLEARAVAAEIGWV